jgi:hypothetical protein
MPADSWTPVGTLSLPTTTIAGKAHRAAAAPKAAAAAPAAEPAPPDIDTMRCAEWRELDMGSGHVQVCQ